jgi:hypothetical protein
MTSPANATQPADDPPPREPTSGLSAYLATLAGQLGYDVDLEELDPVTGFHPRLVVSWALSGARHAGLAHARSLLAGPVAFLREQDAPGDQGDDQRGAEDDGLHACMLADVLRVRDRLDHDLLAAARSYAAACQALAVTGLGLVWPREDPPGQPPPTT